jgi:hypothetical protein
MTSKRRRAAPPHRLIVAVAVLAMLPACGRKTPVRPPELAAPERIESLAASNGPEGIRLTWPRPTQYADGTRMTDLGAFRVERSQASGPFMSIATIALTDQARFQQDRRFRAVDADAIVGETYQYRVIALTTDGYVSEPSNVVTIERALPTPAPAAQPTPHP